MDVLLARKKALAQSIQVTHQHQNQQLLPNHDPFQFETYGHLICPNTSRNFNQQQQSKIKEPKQNVLPETKLDKTNVDSHEKKKTTVSNGKVQKDAPKRPRRFVTNWTDAMDKTIKKSLVKFGWGCWSKIASSGKLPKEYNAKIIANRAKSMGLTKEMFKNPLIPKDSQSKPKPKRSSIDQPNKHTTK